MLQYVSNYFIWYLLNKVVDVIGKRSSIHKLYKHEQWLFEVISKIVCLDWRGAAHLHDSYLCFYLSQCLLFLQFYDPASIMIYHITLLPIISLKYFADGSFSQLMAKYKFGCRILLNKINRVCLFLKLLSC